MLFGSGFDWISRRNLVTSFHLLQDVLIRSERWKFLLGWSIDYRPVKYVNYVHVNTTIPEGIFPEISGLWCRCLIEVI